MRGSPEHLTYEDGSRSVFEEERWGGRRNEETLRDSKGEQRFDGAGHAAKGAEHRHGFNAAVRSYSPAVSENSWAKRRGQSRRYPQRPCRRSWRKLRGDGGREDRADDVRGVDRFSDQSGPIVEVDGLLARRRRRRGSIGVGFHVGVERLVVRQKRSAISCGRRTARRQHAASAGHLPRVPGNHLD